MLISNTCADKMKITNKWRMNNNSTGTFTVMSSGKKIDLAIVTSHHDVLQLIYCINLVIIWLKESFKIS
jgi:hypothetical protein